MIARTVLPTAAFTSAVNAPASTFSPSWMSIALRVLPSKLELKRRDGSGVLAPRANVSFTTFVYASAWRRLTDCQSAAGDSFTGETMRTSRRRLQIFVSPRSAHSALLPRHDVACT